MARKEKLDDFGFDSALDFDDDFNFGSPKIKNDRSAVSVDAMKSVASGFKSTVTSGDYIRSLVRKSLPKEYGLAADVAIETADTVKAVYNDAAKEIKPVISDLKRTTGKILPSVESKLPKGVAEKIKKWSASADSNKFRDLDPEEQRSAMLQMQLGEIFKFQTQAQSQKDSEDKARNALQDAIDNSRHKDSISQLDAIRSSIQQLTGYKLKIESGYQKKMLELQYRQYFIQQDSLTEMKRQNAITSAHLEGILKNTGLPDFVKLKADERLKEVMRNKFIDSTVGLIGKRTQFIKNLGVNIAKVGVEKARDFASNLKMGLDGADMMYDMNQSMAEMGMGRSGTEIVGEMVGGGIANKLGNKLGKKLRTYAGPDTKVGKYANKVGYYAKNAPQLLTDYANTDTFGKERKGAFGKAIGMFDSGNILGAIGEIFRESIRNTNAIDNSLTGDSVSDMEAPAHFTRGTQKSVNEVIPGYLARIYQELQIIRTGNPNVELTTYDFTSNKFSSKSAATRKMFDAITGRGSNSLGQKKLSIKALEDKKKKLGKLSAEDEAELTRLKAGLGDDYATGTAKDVYALIDEVDPKKKLSEEQRKILGLKMISDNLSNRTGSASRLGSTSTYTGAAGKHADIFAGLFNEHFKGDEYGIKQNKFQDKFATLGRDIGDSRKIIQEFLNAGKRDELEELGIIIPGTNQINQEKLIAYMSGIEDMDGGSSINNDPVFTGRFKKVKGKKKGKRASASTSFVAPGETYTRFAGTESSSTVDEKIAEENPVLKYLGGKFDQLSAAITGSDTYKSLKSKFNSNKRVIGAKHAYGKLKADIEDIYMNGENSPVLQAWRLKAGQYRDSVTNEVITTYNDIKGSVLDQNGNVVMDANTIKNSFFTTQTGKRIDLASQVVVDKFNQGKASFLSSGIGKKFVELRDDIKDIWTDVNSSPKMTAAKLKAGEYRDQVTGAVIQTYSDIKGSVIDEKGNVVLDATEIKNAFVKTETGIKTLSALGVVETKAKGFFSSLKSRFNAGTETIKEKFAKSEATFQNSDFQTINETLLRIEHRLNEGINVFGAGGGEHGEARGWNRSIKDVGKDVLGFGGKLISRARGIGKNMFSRGASVAGSLFSLGNKAAGGIMEGIKDRAMGIRDVYVPDEMFPRMLATKIKAGDYKDQKTGSVIRYYKDIKGAVIDEKGNIVLTDEEAKVAYVKELAGKKMLRALGSVINIGKRSLSRGFGMLPGMANTAISLARKAYGLLSLPQDVYTKDKPDVPTLLAKTMRSGGYTSRITGKVISHPGEIDGAVLDDQGNEVLTAAEFAKGIYDKHGKPIRTGFNKLLAPGMEMAGKIIGAGRSLVKNALGRATKLIGGVGSFIRDNVHIGASFGGGGFGGGGDGKLSYIMVTRLTQIRDLINLTLPANRRQNFTDGENDAHPTGAIGGLKGKIAGTFKRLRSRIKGWFGKADPEEINAANAETNSEIRDLLKDRLPKTEKVLPGTYMDELRKKKNQALDKIKGVANPVKGFGLGGIASKIGGFFGKKDGEDAGEGGGIADTVEQAGANAVADKVLGNGGKAAGKGGLLKGAMKMGGKLLGAAGLAYGAYSAYDNIKQGNYGEAALDGGLAVAGGATMFGAGGGLLSAAGAALGGIATALASPVVLGAAAVAAVGVGAYYGYKYLTRLKLTPLSKIRYAQYGFLPTDEENFSKVMSLEAILEDAVTYKEGVAALDERKIKVKEIVENFGIDLKDGQEVSNAIKWFNVRFKPVYLTHLTALNAVDARKSLKDVEDLPDAAKKKYIEAIRFPEGAYGYSSSPFPKGDSLKADKSTVNSLIDAALAEAKKSESTGATGVAVAGTAAAVAATTANAAGDKKAKPSTPEPTFGQKVASATKNALKEVASVADSVGVGFDTVGRNIGGATFDAVESMKKAFGGGKTVVNPTKGTGGKIDEIPNPTGNGSWDKVGGTISAAAKMVGVDTGLMATMAAIESGFDTSIKAATSSATGLYQFIKSTWNNLLSKHGDEYGISKDTPPTDPRANALMGAEFLKANYNALKAKIGRDPTDTDVYLAHFLGAEGAIKLLKADPNAIAAQILPDAARANQPIFYNKDGSPRTVAEVYAEINRRVRVKGKQFGIDVQSSTLPPSDKMPNAANAGNTGIDSVDSPDTTGSATKKPIIPISNQAPGQTGQPYKAVVDTKQVGEDVVAATAGFNGPSAADMSAQRSYKKEADTAAFSGIDATLKESLGVHKAQLEMLGKIFTVIDKKLVDALTGNGSQSASTAPAPDIRSPAQKRQEEMVKPPVPMRKSYT